MKTEENTHLMPIEALLKRNKWDKYCTLANVSDDFRNQVKKHSKQYKDNYTCVTVSEKIADKLCFILKI